MYVRHLQVTDFRSWEHADLAFEPGVSVLVGRNGQGKTNLVEAVGYVATLSSHRVASDAATTQTSAQAARRGQDRGGGTAVLGTVEDAREMVKIAREHSTPMMTSSSLRFAKEVQHTKCSTNYQAAVVSNTQEPFAPEV